jgi:hypothetical protein
MNDRVNSDDDLFAAIKRERGLAPPGEYVGKLISALPFKTKRTEGVEAVIEVTEGEHSGRLIKLRFIADGPSSLDRIIAHNAEILEAWWREVDAGDRPSRKDGFLGVFKTLWRCGQTETLTFRIDVHASGEFSENVLTEVRRADLF